MPAGKVAVLCFLASEAVFFALLLLAYLFLHRSGVGPTAAGALDPRRTGAFTVALVASSGTWWLAERRLRAGRRRAFALLVGASIVLGAVFLGGQAAEWARLLRGGVTPAADPFATAFFTLTGFHGLHVTAGLVILAAAAGLGGGAGAGGRGVAAVEGAGWYWHFVDAVWLAIFAVVYAGAAP